MTDQGNKPDPLQGHPSREWPSTRCSDEACIQASDSAMDGSRTEGNRRLFTRLALLYLAGSLIAVGFRLVNTSGHGAFILWASYSRSSELNTPEEYRYNNHGSIIGIKREVYEANIHWAEAVLILQVLCWLPASILMCWEYHRTKRLPWVATLIVVLGFLAWMVSEVSSI